MTTRRRLVIYHGPPGPTGCLDGHTAAWVLWRRFAPDPVTYHATNYGEDPPWDSIPNSDVYVVDFAYPRHTLERIHRQANLLLVLDHHATAQADLDGLPYAVFDMDRSGAGLTWDWAFMGRPRPWLVDYVEDGDLWRFALPESRAIRCWLTDQPRTFEHWEHLSEMPLAQAMDHGRLALGRMEAQIEARAKGASEQVVGGWIAVVVEAPRKHGSELLHLLLERHPMVTVAIRAEPLPGGGWEYSVRSRGGEARTVAESLGGGGHPNAAGFRTDHPVHKEPTR